MKTPKAFVKIADWYRNLSPTAKGLIWVGVIAVIGIILRWDYIIDHVKRGFEFYNTTK